MGGKTGRVLRVTYQKVLIYRQGEREIGGQKTPGKNKTSGNETEIGNDKTRLGVGDIINVQ